MKKSFRFLMLFAAAATAFASCSKDQTESTPEPPKEKVTIRFTASNDNDTDSEKKAQSRTEFGEGYTIKWTNTDIIGVYINSTLATENAEATAERDQTGVYFMATVNDFAAGDVLTAYYPRAASNASNPAVAEVSIPAEQAQSAVKVFNGQTNPLVAVPFTLASPDNAILEQIKFRQLGAMAEFDIFSEAAEWEGEVIRSVSFTNNGDANIAGAFTYDLTTVTELGTPAAIDPTTLTGGSKSVTVSLPAESTAAVSAAQGANLLYMTLIPGIYTGDLVVTTDKATYTYANRTVDFQRAYVKRFLLDLNRAERKANAGPAGETIIIDYATVNALTELSAQAYSDYTWTINNIAYSAVNLRANTKNEPQTGGTTDAQKVATKQLLALQGSKSNSANFYNTTEMPSIQKIIIYASGTTNSQKLDFDISIGTTAQPTGNPINSQNESVTKTIENIDLESATGSILNVPFTKYVFEFPAGGAYFNLNTTKKTSNQCFIYKIEFQCGIPGPAIKIEGETALAIASDDLTDHVFAYEMANTAEDAALTQDEVSKAWLSVVKGEKDAATGKTPVTYKALSANETNADRTATVTLSATDAKDVVVTVTQKKGATKLTMSDLTISAEGIGDTYFLTEWTAVPGAVKYAYRLTDAQYTAIEGQSGETTELNVTFSGLTPETAYKVHVKAVGNGLDYSDSDEKSADATTSKKQEVSIKSLIAYAEAQNPDLGTDGKTTDVSAYNGGTIEGYIAANNASNNFTGMLSVVDNTGEPGTGIVVFGPAAFEPATAYPVGSKVSISLAGAVIKNFRGLYELTKSDNTAPTVTVLQETAPIVVPEITAAQLNSNAYMGMYVTVKDVATQEAGVWGTSTKTLKDANTAEDITVFFKAGSTFADIAYKVATGNISGVASVYTSAQLIPCFDTDVAAFADNSVKFATTEFTVGATATELSVPFKLNGTATADAITDVRIVTGGEWFTSATKGADAIACAFSANDTAAERTATIVVTITGQDAVTLTVKQTAAGGATEGPAIGTVLWSETWTGGSANETPSSYGQEGTTVFNGATVTYVQSNTNTKLYKEKLAGGTAPELLLAKSNQTWTISGIPIEGVSQASLTMKANNATRTVITYYLDGNGNGVSAEKGISAVINNTTNAKTVTIEIKNTSGSNVRLDDIELKVTE